MLDFLILLVIAAIAGSIGQALAGYSRGGCLVSIIVGFIGAWIGLWIAREFQLPTLWVITVGDQAFPIVWSIIGSAIFAAIVGMIFRQRRQVV